MISPKKFGQGEYKYFAYRVTAWTPATLDALRQLLSAALRDTYMNRLPVSPSGAWRDANHPFKGPAKSCFR
jgi:uncharacterized protein (DUF2267 family)